MKQRKRAFAFLLALLMAVTSISIPSVTVRAEEGVETWTAELEGVYQFGDYPEKTLYEDSEFDEIVHYNAAPSWETEELKLYLYQEMKKRAAPIELSSYNIPFDAAGKGAPFAKLLSGIINEHPDLYFVKQSWSYTPQNIGGVSYLKSLQMSYEEGLSDDTFNNMAVAALACVKPGMTDMQKAIVLHDYLAVNCEYDYDNLKNETLPDISHSAYGALVNQIAVCDGYALAYKYLLNWIGIECYMVTSDEINHAWNIVKLGDEFYHVDVTWDDPTRDMTGRACHEYMFRSEADFRSTTAHANSHDAVDWVVTKDGEEIIIPSVDISYDVAFWDNCTSPIVVSGGDCYYVASPKVDSELHLLDEAKIKQKRLVGEDIDITSEGEDVYTIGNWGYLNAYSGLFQVNGRLYFNNAESIWSIDPSVSDTGKGVNKEFTPDPAPSETNGYIFGSALRQGTIYYAMHTELNLDVKEEVKSTSISFSIPIPPIKEVDSVDFEDSAITLTVAESQILEAVLTPNDTIYSTSWTSSDPSVATVNSKGKVTGVAVGECTITATAGGKTATCTVTVTAPAKVAVESVKLDVETLALKVGETGDLKATVKPDNATDKTVTWTSNKTTVATVDSATGKVTAVAVGECTITATADGKTATCTVTVTAPEKVAVESVALNAETLALKVGETGDLKATVKPDNATDKTVTWTSDKAAVATVDNAGKVTAVAAGECTITATADGKTATCKVTVTAAEPENPSVVESVALNVTELSLKIGESSTVAATVKPDTATDKTVVWTSDDTEVALVNNAGKVTAIGEGTCTITATAGGKTATCVVTVEEDFRIIANKSKVNYLVNEVLTTDDLVIYDRNGQEIDSEEYSTNIDEIDMSVAGTQYLIVTYKGETAVIKIEIFQDAKDYLIRFDGNGADGGEMASQRMRQGSSTPLSANAFTRKGYTFDGWNTQPDGEGASYSDKGTVATLTQNAVATLYAQWKANQYTVKYEGGADATGSMSDQTRAYDEVFVLTNSFKREGFGFTGWKDAAGKIYSAGQNVSGLTAEADGVVTLTAQWEANAYAITYVLGEEGMNSHENRAYCTSAGVTLKEPVRNGYTFAGWYKDSKCTKRLANDTIEPTGADITVYAKWTAKKVKVKFDANKPAKGGRKTGTMKAQSITFGKGTKLTGNAFKVVGYTFAGWNTLANPTIADPGIAYENKAATDLALIERASGEEVTLYAQWRPTTFKITYTNAVNGKNGVENALPTTYDVEDANIRLDLLNGEEYKPTREGYTFGGWYKDAKFKKELPASTIDVSAAKNLTIYAKWEPVKTVVTFDPNMPIDKEVEPKEQTVTIGKTLKANSFTAKGYRFSGWNTDPGGSGTKYKNGARVTVAFIRDMGEEATLYAQWTPIKSEFKYKITYSGAVDGKNGVVNENPLGHDGEEEISLDAPEREGYTFTGWTYNGKKLGEDATIPKTKSNITVKANWKGFSTTVEYNSNDDNGKTKTQKVTYGKTKKLTANGFKRAGYTFAGWSMVPNPDDESMIYSNKAAVTLDIVSDNGNPRDEDETVVLYAQWEPVKYKISYVNASMKMDVSGNAVPTYYTVENKSIASKDSLASDALLLPSPVRAGYTFAGWYTDKKLTKPLSEFDTSKKKAVTFYAKWTPNGYTVVYDANGGTGASFSQTATYGKDVKLQPNRFVNEGKTFVGWSTSPTAGSNDVIYSSMSKVKNLTLGSKVTLYARWK